MSHASNLKYIAFAAERQEEAVNSLAFCFDAYLEFTRDGREPTKYADGTVAMDAAKATAQLENAIRRVIGLPQETPA